MLRTKRFFWCGKWILDVCMLFKASEVIFQQVTFNKLHLMIILQIIAQYSHTSIHKYAARRTYTPAYILCIKYCVRSRNAVPPKRAETYQCHAYVRNDISLHWSLFKHCSRLHGITLSDNDLAHGDGLRVVLCGACRIIEGCLAFVLGLGLVQVPATCNTASSKYTSRKLELRTTSAMAK
jgi:hypothetical protein